MSKVSAVILARLSSRRLPGKALMEIEGKKVLEIIIERLRKVFNNEDIILATSDHESDDALEAFCEEIRIGCYRGSLDDVASRFYNAALSIGADYAIRINGDNVFVDTDTLSEMCDLALNNSHDFISNVDKRTFPTGMSIEILDMAFYNKYLPVIAADDYYKEHVTKYLYDHPECGNYKYVYNESVPEAAGMKLALDTPEDYEKISSIIQVLGTDHINANLSEVMNAWKQV